MIVPSHESLLRCGWSCNLANLARVDGVGMPSTIKTAISLTGFDVDRGDAMLAT
jgi:hypothetical protein